MQDFKDKSLIISVIIATSIATFFVAYISSAISIVLPTLAKYFSINDILENWISLIYLLIIAIFALPCGALSKKYGLVKTFLTGLFIFLVGSILAGFSTTAYFILFSRAVEALGASFLYVAGTAMIVKATSKKLRGTALGINLASFYLGLTLAPFLGGFLATNYNWQSIFFIQVPFLVIAILLVAFKIKKNWILDKEFVINKKDLFLNSTSILLLMLGFLNVTAYWGIILIVVGAILGVLYIKSSAKEKNPLFKLEAYKNINFLTSNVASLTSYVGIYVLTYILNYHFQYVNGFSPEKSGLYLVIAPLVMTITAVISGRISDKKNPQFITVIGMVFVTLSIFMMALINRSTTLEFIILAMIVYGVGYGLFASPNTKVIMSSLPIEYNDFSSTAVASTKYIGKTVSLAILTLIFAIFMGTASINPSDYSKLIISSQITCYLGVIFAIIALIATVIGYKSNTPLND